MTLQTNQLTHSETVDSAETTHVELVTFEVNDKHFGIPVSEVEEVIEFIPPTPAPGSLEGLEGVIDLRGDIIPVMDLHKRLGISIPESRSNSRILITEMHDYIFGLIVDKVNNVCLHPLAEFHPPPPGTNSVGSEYTVGILRQPDQLLLYLDLERVLNIGHLLEEAS